MANLENYKKGNLSPEELETFTNSFLRASFEQQQKDRWGELLEQDHEIAGTTATRKGPFKRTRYLWLSGVAAAGLLLFGIFMYSSSNSNYEVLVDQYLAEGYFENQELTKGSFNTEQLYTQAIIAYNQQNFSTAAEQLERIAAMGEANDKHLFFLGLSYLYQEQASNAIAYLEQVMDKGEEATYIKECRWFLALAYLKNQQLEQAKHLLRTIVHGDWHYDQAFDLLKKIK